MKPSKDLLLDIACVTLIAIMIYVLVRLADLPRTEGAPAPFPRKQVPAQLTPDRLAGNWRVKWGDVLAKVALKRDGGYRCKWCGTDYIGSWGLDREGRLWITESCRPELAGSWQSYAIKLSPRTLRGPVVSGATGVTVELKKE